MSDDLRPLSPEEQHEFDHRRESASVVQHKCAACGAWYETPRLATEWVEKFTCACGNAMTFTVPAIEVAKLVIPAAGLDLTSPDARLDTGMKISEAIARASAWWDKDGRKIMLAQVQAEGAIEQSGIVNAEPWDMLNREEKLAVVKAWHHFNIRVPDMIGTPEHEFSFTSRRPN